MLSVIAGLLLSISVNYTPPVDYDMSLAGTFGEPRPNHFHGGIDVKTGGVEGKPIYSVGDGYISRITVGLYGFGNALYVSHPDGNTSVYCHLKSFSPRIDALVKKWQYSNLSYFADIRLIPHECPLARGQFIALSGNTGSSTAPHLHLEFHDTKTWAMVDPLDFLKSYICDNVPPMAHCFMAYPIAGRGSFNGSGKQQTFRFVSHDMSDRFYAWGMVGFGIWADDYSEVTYNRYGIRETILLVDGKEVFHSDVDRIPVQNTRMVNSWGDYSHYYHSGVWYMKSFHEHGNILPFLKTDDRSGIVNFSEERDYNIEYILKDIHGNRSSYCFTVTGKRDIQPIADKEDAGWLMPWNRTNMLSYPGMQLVIPPGLLDGNTELAPKISSQPEGYSDRYTFCSRSLPLFHWAELCIAVNRKVKDPTKLYISSDAAHGHYLGGEYKDGWVYGRMRDLGASYELDYDDTPPTVIPIGLQSWNVTKVIRFELADDRSGIKSCKGYVDGAFVLFEHVDKSRVVKCDLRDTPIKKTGAKRNLLFLVTDNRDNIRRFDAEIIY